MAWRPAAETTLLSGLSWSRSLQDETGAYLIDRDPTYFGARKELPETWEAGH